MDLEPSAPPVVAVVVASRQGEWFDDALLALGQQDYPNQSVLVVDPDPHRDSAARVAAVLPDAYLRRVTDRAGFAAIANEALETVQGSAFLLFCRDDIALAPDAVRLLVEEALRSNAGVVSPKITEWDDPTRLVDVGLAVDKTGSARPIVDRRELDQEQHDAVRDVFAVSGACILVRSDLFFELGGFDPLMAEHGADIDLCWRAQVAGARVMVVPAALARQGDNRDLPGSDPGVTRDEARNRLRTALKCYSLLHLLRVLPQAAVATIGEASVAIFRGQWRQAVDFCAAWWWNLRHWGQLRALRRRVQKARAVPDSEVRRLQVRGSVRLRAYLEGQLQAGDRARALLSAGQELVDAANRGPARVAALMLAILVFAVLVGTRDLFGEPLPAVGQFAPIPGPGRLLSNLFGGWRTTGMGSGAPIPTAFGLLGLSGIAVLGSMGFLQKLIVLGCVPLGVVGAWRLGRPFGSLLARLTLAIAYLAIPLPYNALARGRLSGLVAYAVAPWALARIARLSRLAPFAVDTPDPAVERARRRADVVTFGVILAPALALAPSVAIAILLAALGMAVGSMLTGESKGATGGLVAAVATVGIAAVLLFPWSLDLLLPGGWSTVAGASRAPDQAWGLGALLRFEVGPLGSPPIGWAFALAGAVPLLVARGERLAWAVRFWIVALVCIGVAWAGGHGWLPGGLQTPDVLLAPAAAALAAAAAMGAVALAVDLPGYRFGWRQAATQITGVALALGMLPVLGAAANGRWDLPSTSVAESLSWMLPQAQQGAFRVLWVGDPEALPLDSWPASDGVGYATSRNGPPDATALWPGSPSEATEQLRRSIELAQRGDTSRLGRLLAPMAVRYIVVPAQLGAVSSDAPDLPPPPALETALGSQIDLRLLPSEPGVTIYENTAWGPLRQIVPPALADVDLPPSLGPGADLTGALPALPGRGPVRFKGPLPGGSRVLVSETPSSRWALSVDGDSVPREEAFGVANTYATQTAGQGVLRYRTPLLWYGAVVGQVVLWFIALRSVRRLRRRRRQLVAMEAASR